jgi:D-glycero-D-manno-heptose 1,7-bisphosphate phosphatase
MLLDAAAALGLDLAASWVVGDSDTDVEAGRRAGCRTVLIEHPGSRHRRRGAVEPDHSARDLDEATSVILSAPGYARRG